MKKNKSYSAEFKLKVIEKYYEGGISLEKLSQMFQIPSKSQVHSWIQKYETFGIDGFKFNYKKKGIEKILERDLNDVLRLNVQPIYSKNGELKKYEVLSRFYKEKLGVIPTVSAIKILDKLNSLHILDFLVIEKIKKSEVYINNKLAINISPNTLLHPNFLKKIEKLEKKFYENIEFEIIEIGKYRYDKISKVIKKIKQKGIKIIMDDYPKGGSNLDNLLNGDYDGVKIDRSLLTQIQTIEGKDIYSDIVKILKKLNKVVTIEGVETKEELEFIKELDVDFIQGYFLGMPISIDRLW
ncbi:MAG: EAL domain-containing protein [Cetobacterium sp.]|uniref:EAL domain-containing protein n=1 Tax=Cetobacterium sp. TaxID=2071632 RepID=UPI003EE76611